MSDAAADSLPPPPSRIAVSSAHARCLSAAPHDLPATYISAFAGGNTSPILADPSSSLPCSCGALTDGQACRCGSGSTPLPMQETLILPMGMEQPPSATQLPDESPDSPPPAATVSRSVSGIAGVSSTSRSVPATVAGAAAAPPPPPAAAAAAAAAAPAVAAAAAEANHQSNRHHHGAVFAGAAALSMSAPRTSEVAPAAGAAAADAGAAAAKPAEGEGSCPPFAVKSTCGKRQNMEDTYAFCPNICELPMSPMAAECADKFPQRIAMQLNSSALQPYMTAATAASEDLAGSGPAMSATPRAVASAPAAAPAPRADCSGGAQPSTPPQAAGSSAAGRLMGSGTSSSSGGSSTTCLEQLHFFGVYDGHGGTEASLHCAQRLHHHLSEALLQIGSVWCDSNQFLPCVEAEAHPSWDEGEPMLSPDAADGERSLARDASGLSSGDGDASTTSSGSGNEDAGSDTTFASINCLMEQALRNAFLKTDEEFSGDNTAGLVGSTAVVALVGTHRVWIANCGDSRAVLSRNGRAIQVTDDHKPEREDEAERVEKAGGQVLYWNGHRVMGVLAMSRAIGDHCLRPYVIPEPEISVFARHARDEIMLLASDGLWDVMSNQEATDLALRAIRRAQSKGASKKAAARVAATVLTKAAVDRGSRDNITVVIIDLSRSTGPVASAAQGERTAVAGPATPASATPTAGAASAAAATVATAAAAAAGPAAEQAEVGGGSGGSDAGVATWPPPLPARAPPAAADGAAVSCSSCQLPASAGSPFGAAAFSPFIGAEPVPSIGPPATNSHVASQPQAPDSSSKSSSRAPSGGATPASAFSGAAGEAPYTSAAAAEQQHGEEQDDGHVSGSGSSRLLEAGHAKSLVQELHTLDLHNATAAGVQHFAASVVAGTAGDVDPEELQQQLTVVAPPLFGSSAAAGTAADAPGAAV